MLSGVGDRDELLKNNITPKHHLPGVGKNLQEHVDAIVVRNAVRGKKGRLALRPRDLVKEILSALTYPLTGRGVLAGIPAEAGGFFRSTDDKDIPDLQWVFFPSKINDHGRDNKILRSRGYSAHVALLRPKSCGQVSLVSADPLAAPKIHLNMLSHPDDVKDLIAGVKKTRALLSASAFSEYLADELFPGEGCQSDETIEEWLRRSANHVYHPIGTRPWFEKFACG